MNEDVWIFCGVVIFSALGIAAAVYDSQRWEDFSKQHHCKKVGEQSGSHVYGGKNLQYIEGKTGYLCDDGITYWR